MATSKPNDRAKLPIDISLLYRQAAFKSGALVGRLNGRQETRRGKARLRIVENQHTSPKIVADPTPTLVATGQAGSVTVMLRRLIALLLTLNNGRSFEMMNRFHPQRQAGEEARKKAKAEAKAKQEVGGKAAASVGTFIADRRQAKREELSKREANSGGSHWGTFVASQDGGGLFGHGPSFTPASPASPAGGGSVNESSTLSTSKRAKHGKAKAAIEPWEVLSSADSPVFRMPFRQLHPSHCIPPSRVHILIPWLCNPQPSRRSGTRSGRRRTCPRRAGRRCGSTSNTTRRQSSAASMTPSSPSSGFTAR